MSREMRVEEVVRQVGSVPPRLMLASSMFSNEDCT